MFRIPCPQCGKSLKVTNPASIGRKARCPGCNHRFVLQIQAAPDEVELQLAETPQPTTTHASPAQPLVGTGARWVPDDAQSEPDHGQPAAVAAVVEPVAAAPADAIPFVPAEEITSPLAEIRKRKQQRGKTGSIVGLVGLLMAATIGVIAVLSQPAAENSPDRPAVVTNAAWQAEKKQLQDSAIAARDVSPTSGQPIDLKYLIPGANILVHLHPSEIWSEDESRVEFVYALGPVNDWLKKQIRDLARFEPEEIEQLTIAVGLGPRESKPEVSAVVRLIEPQQRSSIIRQRFKSQRDPNYDQDMFVGENRAWLLIDEKTFAVGPADLAADLAAASSFGADPADDLRLLVQDTDRDRHITVLLDTSAVDIHANSLLGEQIGKSLTQVLDWLGKDVAAVALSFHLGDRFFLETRLRNGTGTTAAKLNRAVHSKLSELPSDLLAAVQYMRPRQAGPRRIIARFPAMVQAFVLGTESGIGNRFVQLTTVLPERAIPNLAVGTLLTWDEATRTDFTRERQSTSGGKGAKKLPDTLAERLRLKIEVEFKRTPLQEAFALLGEDIGVTFELDGDGLKLAGYTQNMPQSFNLGEVPAIEGVREILKQYDQMVLIADEATKTITVSTRAAATDRGDEIYDLK